MWSGSNTRCARVTCRKRCRASTNSTLSPRGPFALPLSRNHSVTGRVTVKNMLGPTATMQSTAPVSISFFRSSRSLPPASEALLAMTKPARPVGFSAA